MPRDHLEQLVVFVELEVDRLEGVELFGLVHVDLERLDRAGRLARGSFRGGWLLFVFGVCRGSWLLGVFGSGGQELEQEEAEGGEDFWVVDEEPLAEDDSVLVGLVLVEVLHGLGDV